MAKSEVEELKQQVEHLEAKFTSIKRRHTALQQRVDEIYRHPFRFLLQRWYHRYIKRDQIV